MNAVALIEQYLTQGGAIPADLLEAYQVDPQQILGESDDFSGCACHETDEGDDPYTKGITTTTASHADYCVLRAYVVEGYCSGGAWRQVLRNCGTGKCVLGKCIP